uniref:Peptide deformylase n=1 Tax=Timema tahoe TaxID=61484 RepID=A0A7R9FN00_9NEOP|nr:unnamed protein product [Timema tahoe]
MFEVLAAEIKAGLNERGEAVSLQVAGWPARIVQHEMDHLIGRLYTDSMMRSSLACTAWHQVNVSGGKLHIPYTPKKKNYTSSIDWVEDNGSSSGRHLGRKQHAVAGEKFNFLGNSNFEIWSLDIVKEN